MTQMVQLVNMDIKISVIIVFHMFKKLEEICDRKAETSVINTSKGKNLNICE